MQANFRKWFEQSKVVDASGAPLVLYHSSTADFERFKRSPKDLGMHFGTAGQALDRFLLKQHRDPYGVALGRAAPCTLPVYLSIARPLRLPDLGDWERDTVVGHLPDEFTIAELVKACTHAQLRDLIRSHGYDGIVYTNEREAPGAHGFRLAIDEAFRALMLRFPQAKNPFAEEPKRSAEYAAYLAAVTASRVHLKAMAQDSWIAFEPGQIKSAIGNCGAYDRKNPNITDFKAAARTRPAAQEAWLADEHLSHPMPAP